MDQEKQTDKGMRVGVQEARKALQQEERHGGESPRRVPHCVRFVPLRVRGVRVLVVCVRCEM